MRLKARYKKTRELYQITILTRCTHCGLKERRPLKSTTCRHCNHPITDLENRIAILKNNK